MTMKKTEYRRAIDALGLSQVKASEFFEVSRKTSPRWARGEAPIPGAVTKLLRVMVHREISPAEVDELGKISPEEVDK
jgi:DNA-binding transcriptional regulator YiaG